MDERLYDCCVHFKTTYKNKKAIKELLEGKGLQHYIIEFENKDKLDLVKYADYQKLEFRINMGIKKVNDLYARGYISESIKLSILEMLERKMNLDE